jgi:general secretion pathway protein G
MEGFTQTYQSPDDGEKARARRIHEAIRRARRSRAGMTLVEIMVVITILGLIIGVVGVSVVSYLKDAEKGVAAAQIKNLKTAVQRFRQKSSSYPNSLEDIAEYMEDKKIPKDPWGEPYIYQLKDDGFSLHSKGPDKQDGTEDDVK